MKTLMCGSMLWGALLMLAAVPTAQAQRSSGGCPGGVCPTPAMGPPLGGSLGPSAWSVPVQVQTSNPTWQWIPAGGGYALFRDGRQVGSWVTGDQAYYPFDGVRFGSPAQLPTKAPADAVRPAVPVPVPGPDRDPDPDGGPRIIGAGPPTPSDAVGAVEADWRTHGVAPERLGVERYSLSGRDCSRIAVIEALVTAGGSLVDDSDRCHLALILPDADRARILTDLVTHPRLSSLRTKIHVQSYGLDHWRVRQYSLPTGILFEEPNGKTIGQWATYQGPDWLADQLERRKPPTPGPNPGPDPNPTPSPVAGVPTWMLVVGGIVLVLFLMSTMRRPTTP